jgi:hypothetical protein
MTPPKLNVLSVSHKGFAPSLSQQQSYSIQEKSKVHIFQNLEG